jgi:hypothetical protein
MIGSGFAEDPSVDDVAPAVDCADVASSVDGGVHAAITKNKPATNVKHRNMRRAY